jgi:hypothetical protein
MERSNPWWEKSRLRRQCGERGEGDVRGRRELERGRVLELLDQEVRRIGIQRELERKAL